MGCFCCEDIMKMVGGSKNEGVDRHSEEGETKLHLKVAQESNSPLTTLYFAIIHFMSKR